MISLDFLFARSPLAEDCFISHLAESKRTTREALTKILILLRLHLPRRKFAVCVCQMEQKTKRNPPNAKRNIWVLFFLFRFFFFRTHLAKNARTKREARKIFLGFSFSARNWQKTRAQGAKRKFFVVSVFLFQITFSRKRRHEARSAKNFFWGVFFFSSHLEEGPGTRQGAGTAPRKEKRKKKKRFATQP